MIIPTYIKNLSTHYLQVRLIFTELIYINKALCMKSYIEVFEELKRDLYLIQPTLREMNLLYFNSHKNRYLSDLEIIEHYHETGRILEFGSFPFHLTYCLKKLGYDIVGLDINPIRAEEFINKHNLVVKKCDFEIEKVPFEDNSINLIVFNEIFEHLRIDPIKTLKEVNRVMKPGAIMILTTPNLYSIERIISFNVGKGFNIPYDEFKKLHTIGHMGHIREYSTNEVRQFLENADFRVIDVMYKIYDKRYKDNNKINGKLIAHLLLDLGYQILPKLRPSQVIISKKVV